MDPVSGFSNFLLLIGYHHPQLARDILAPESTQGKMIQINKDTSMSSTDKSNDFPGVVEKEEIEILPKRYRPDNLSALCAATG